MQRLRSGRYDGSWVEHEYEQCEPALSFLSADDVDADPDWTVWWSRWCYWWVGAWSASTAACAWRRECCGFGGRVVCRAGGTAIDKHDGSEPAQGA